MKPLVISVAAALLCAPAMAEPLSYSEARKLLPRANAKAAIGVEASLVPETDRARLEGARQSIDDVLASLGAALPAYGALAISPSEGLFVEWLNGTGQHHSVQAAHRAALDYCNAKRKRSSAPCQIVVQVTPRGAKPGAALSLSGPAIAAFRGAYRKLNAPKAFAISPSTGSFGFDRGDGGRALEACARAGARDCKIVVAD
jgi:hypothetical protein